MTYMSVDQALELKNRLWSYIEVMQDYYNEFLKAGGPTQNNDLMPRRDMKTMWDMLRSYTACICDIREYLCCMKDAGQIRPESLAVVEILISKIANNCPVVMRFLEEKMTAREAPGKNDSDEITRPEGIKDIFEDETSFQEFTSGTASLCKMLSALYEWFSSKEMECVYDAPRPHT